MADERSPRVAYVAYSTFNTALATLKEGIPPKMDRTVFRGQSGGIQAQLMAAFKALGLINESNEPNRPILDRLVSDATRKAALKEVLEDKYRAFVDLARNHGTEQQYMDQFREMGVTGDTLQKAMTFFQNAANDVGIPLSTHVARKAKSGSNDGTPKRGRRPRQRRGKLEDSDDGGGGGSSTSGSTYTVTLESGGSAALTVSVDLITLSDTDRDWVVGAVKYFRSYANNKEAQA